MTTPTTQPRRFNKSQRRALWLASNGRCAACGKPLPPGWHADHWEPYVHGGSTDVTNGQALCPECNLLKGATMSPKLLPWPDTVPLRQWQAEAVQRYERQKQRDFLLVATPGAGKTTAALRIAHWLMAIGEIDGLVVIVPTEHLRQQWANAAWEKARLQLNPDWTNGNPFETADFHGFCATYHAVGANADIYRMVCNRRRTLVILDEVHHAGDSLSWGRAVRQAFESATYRLMLSGTPFRSDNNTIPFVKYADGKSVADFPYSMGDALQDSGVLRPVMFPKYDGQMRWLADDGVRSVSFAEALSDEEASRRLRTALDVGGDWLRQVIGEADKQLCQIRRSPDDGGAQADAGGLILCIDQNHARRVAALVHQITGEAPTIAISEDADASAKIKDFATGTGRWLVSVRMVSEGVDIPRLYVGVYATNVITELFFRQVVGRLVRWTAGVENQVAVLFIPQEATLVAYAERVQDEQAQAIEEIERRLRDWAEERDEARDPRTFVPIGSEAQAGGYVYNGQQYPPEQVAEATRRCTILGITDPKVVLAVTQALALDWPATIPTVQPAPAPPTQPAYDQRRELRAAGALKAKRLGFLAQELAPRSDYPGHQIVNSKVAATIGCAVGRMDIPQLLERLKLLDRWINEAQSAKRDGVGTAWLVRWEER